MVDVSDQTLAATGTQKEYPWSVMKADMKTYMDTLYESHTSNDIDPDRLSGDASDDNKIDQDIIEGFGASATPAITLQDSDNAVGSGAINANSSGGANAIVLTIGVEDSTGESVSYIEIDGSNKRVESKKDFYAEKLLGMTPQSKDYSTASSLDQTIGTDLTSLVILVTCDADETAESIDLQDGTVAGQTLIFIGVTGLDDNDTFTIDMSETTCTGCPALVLNDPGENVAIYWTGSTWAYLYGYAIAD
jgi:hypothetical protein